MQAPAASGATRKEKDLLGEKEVSAEAYYGIQTLRSSENFPITGLRMHASLIRAFAMVKMAAARANVSLGYLEEKVGEAISQAAQEIMAGRLHEYFIVDVIQGGAGTSMNMNVIQGGAGTSMNMNANEVLANRAIELLGGEKGDYNLVHPLTHVNMSQSTNDVFPTAARLAMLFQLEDTTKALNDLVHAFREKAEEFRDVIKMGRTHLQDAVPITLGQEFGAYAQAVKRDLERIERSAQGLKVINLGATAVGTGLNADPQYISLARQELEKITGYSLESAENLVDATQNVDIFTEVSTALKMAATTLSKIANDLRLLASGPFAGLKEINLPPVQPGSSIMPGKVNPVIPEVVNQVAFQIMGNDLTVSLAAQAGQLELNVFEPVLVFNLLQSIDILGNVVRVFIERSIRGVTANEDRCRFIVENNIGILTALNPYLSYDVVSHIAKEALATGKPVRDLVLQTKILTEEELNIILSPEQMTRPGIAGAKKLKEKLLKLRDPASFPQVGTGKEAHESQGDTESGGR
ncbi:MAG: aspartate ammonia-lyase [Firmicutes bacterium]|nr:aspartate ammonia-lyase [Bacillota bacterium]